MDNVDRPVSLCVFVCVCVCVCLCVCVFMYACKRVSVYLCAEEAVQASSERHIATDRYIERKETFMYVLLKFHQKDMILT